jgi:hypothetical protein
MPSAPQYLRHLRAEKVLQLLHRLGGQHPAVGREVAVGGPAGTD